MRETQTAYKLTDQALQTHCGFQWTVGEWEETDGTAGLCGPGWLHFYSDPALALIMNPAHANIRKPRLWRVEVSGEFKADRGLKCGWTRARLVEELPLPDVTPAVRVHFAILCAKAAYSDEAFLAWADGWLNGADRTAAAASCAYAASYASASSYAAETAASAAAYAASAAYDLAAYAAAGTAAASAAAAGSAMDVAAIARAAIAAESQESPNA